MPVRVGGVTLDLFTRAAPPALCVTGRRRGFDTAFARIRSAGVTYYADHDRSGRGEINHHYGGRDASQVAG